MPLAPPAPAFAAPADEPPAAAPPLPAAAFPPPFAAPPFVAPPFVAPPCVAPPCVVFVAPATPGLLPDTPAAPAPVAGAPVVLLLEHAPPAASRSTPNQNGSHANDARTKHNVPLRGRGRNRILSFPDRAPIALRSRSRSHRDGAVVKEALLFDRDVDQCRCEDALRLFGLDFHEKTARAAVDVDARQLQDTFLHVHGHLAA